jgi:polygalacturonase
MTRRQFLYTAAVAAPAFALPQTRANDPWSRAAAIARRIVPPRFPSRDFDVTKFGAVGDGEKSGSDAIRKAIAIEGCTFDTGDDCIALKSGRNEDGRRLHAPIENVIVRGCTMKDGHGGVVLGSEISGGARNIFAERCRMDSPQLDRALRIKTNSVRGGRVEGVYMRDVTVGQVAEAVVTIDYFLRRGRHRQVPADRPRRRGPERHQPTQSVRTPPPRLPPRSD